jgi:hypothetical protein
MTGRTVCCNLWHCPGLCLDRLKNIAKILSKYSRYNIYAGQTDGFCQFKEGLSVSRYVCWFAFHFYENKTKTMLTITYKMQAIKGIQLHASFGVTLLTITGKLLPAYHAHRW